MPRPTNLASMSVDALLKLRDDIGVVLSRRADELKKELSRLGAVHDGGRPDGASRRAGRKVAPKYRDPKSGDTWAGRGAQPVWLREKLKKGGKLDDYLIVRKTVATRKKAAARRKGK